MSKVIVIGGGAAGMMAALKAADNGHDVTLLEKNEKLGKKLFRKGSLQRDKCLRYGDNHESDRDKSTFPLQCVF